MTEATHDRAQPVAPAGAALLLTAALVVAALVSVSVARLVPDESGDDTVTVRRDTPIPMMWAPAPGLADVTPLVTFDDGLPEGWETVTGEWSTVDGQAAATDVGTEGALGVFPVPADTTAVQVTLATPRPGAGLVVGYTGPDDYVALVVGRAGQTIEMIEVDGDRGSPRRLALAPLISAVPALVIALRRAPGGMEAIANGDVFGRRIVDEPEGEQRVGLVTGFRGLAEAARFDDLTVA